MGSAAVTKQRILDAAERMFGTHGFDGTTLRNVVKDAAVNLALVSYHFGSKEELYQAVIARMAEPIVKSQLAALEPLEAADALPTLEAVLTAYMKPPMDNLLINQELALERAKFFSRYYMEPASVQALANKEFASSDERFLDMFQRILPEQSRMQLFWKLDAVVMMLVRSMSEIGKPYALIKSNSKADIETAASELVAFAASGMRGSYCGAD